MCTFNPDIVAIAQTLARVRGGDKPKYVDLINALADTSELFTFTELDRGEALVELLRRYPEIASQRRGRAQSSAR